MRVEGRSPIRLCTGLADERLQVIEQRITTRDVLLGLVLFAETVERSAAQLVAFDIDSNQTVQPPDSLQARARWP